MVLDCAAVTIGSDVLIGPNVGIYTATHPVDPGLRRDGLEFALPVTIEDGVWIGGHTAIGPGRAHRAQFRDRRGKRGDEGHSRQRGGCGKPLPRDTAHYGKGPRGLGCGGKWWGGRYRRNGGKFSCMMKFELLLGTDGA